MLGYDKSMGSFKMCVTQERGEEKLTKKVTKSDLGGGFVAKKCDAANSKKRDFASDVLFEWSLYFLWVYLLVMSLAFCETNKPYRSK